MMKWLQRLLDAWRGRGRQAYQLPDEADRSSIQQIGVPVEDTADGRRFAIIARGFCPHCEKPARFYEGPSGGMSTNIQCNQCGWWFNVTPAIGIAEDIGEKDDRPKRNPGWRPEI